MPQLVGPAIAKQWYFTAERVHADELYQRGVLNKLCSDDTLHEESLAMAVHIAAGPPSAIRGMKANLNDATRGIEFRQGLDNEAVRLGQVDKAQSREAIAAFVSKRTPIFE